MEVRIRAALMALSLVLLSACGGGGSGSSEFDGVWRGTYAPDGTDPVPLFAMADGDSLFFYDHTGLVFVVSKFPGVGDVDQGGTVFPARGFVFDSDSFSLPFTVKGMVSAGKIAGSITINGGTVQTTLDAYRPFSGDPSVVPGKWSGEFLTPNTSSVDITSEPKPISLTVAADGTFSGTESGCPVNGTITPAMDGHNMFQVSLTEHLKGSSGCEGAFTGLAYEGDSDEQAIFGNDPGTYYYLVAAGANGASAIAAELHVD